MFEFSSNNMRTPGKAKTRNSLKLLNVLLVGQYHASLISFWQETYKHKNIIVKAAVIL
jgi:hypothetical protein